MNTPLGHIDIALVSVSAPILCGIYEQDRLIKTIQSDELALIALPRIFEAFLPRPHKAPQSALPALDSIPDSMSDSVLDSMHLTYKGKIIESIYYAQGPGSFTSLKLTHIFLHTLSLMYDVKLFATSSFYFTKSPYIKAFGTTYFHRDEMGNITLARDNVRDETNSIESTQNIESTPSADSIADSINAKPQHKPLQEGFFLPDYLDKSAFHTHTQPLYILPALH
ncbi:hypothetical protein LS71_006255 [Helicobacter jaachi]|uniref:Uncharacterized protein n=1 Tax=Helicobacter jaachi TaxID=1677920 RepID=A0A4V6I2J6_9HELI|nr:hypothetical protein [Helicobacter jaachi]TLD96322.1 hypothetical protein LS71_006255 [Helicobacter jaachi]